MKDFAITIVVSSDSSEKLSLARQVADGNVQPDSVLTDVGTANDRVYVQHHRLGDYFSSVQVADRDSTSFQLVFVPRRNPDRYWKDLVVKILASIRDSGVSIRFLRKNED